MVSRSHSLVASNLLLIPSSSFLILVIVLFHFKSKGEREIYTRLNAEFQRIARRDKKALLNEQCKEIEENNRMENTRDLFKKIRDTKGTFHAKMGLIKDRNGMNLTEAEEVARIHRRTVQKRS